MANRTAAHGLTAEAKAKIAGKYDTDLEAEARQWIEALTGEKLDPADLGADNFHAALKNGQTLCKLINVLEPGAVKKITTKTMPFMQMENIGNFLAGAEKYGVAKGELFQTVDLYEAQNMTQVVNSIHALGRMAQKKGFNGPTIGVKESDKNEREFTEEQMKAGQNVIGLQMGTNKGASQAGQNFGKQRMIID